MERISSGWSDSTGEDIDGNDLEIRFWSQIGRPRSGRRKRIRAFIKMWSSPSDIDLEDREESKTAQNPIFYSIFSVFHEF